MVHRRVLIPLLLMLTLLPGLWLDRPPSAAEERRVSLRQETGSATSQTPSQPEIHREPGVYRVFYGDRDQLASLAASFGIWEVQPEAGYAVVALDSDDANRLIANGYRLELSVEKTRQSLLGPPDYACYRDVEEIYAVLHQLVAQYPALTELIDYGDSWRKVKGREGHDLWALRITNSQLALPKPRFFLMANIHGRELTTAETALYFADFLLESYGSDPDPTWIVDSHEVYIVITANPDGRQLVEGDCYQRKNRNDTAGSCNTCDPWGTNHYGVDLNRNNPYRWGGAGTGPCEQTYQGTTAASEPETYYLNALVRSVFPDQRNDDDATPSPSDSTGLLITLHSYSNLVLWPWGWTYAGAPNESQLQTLGRKFAFFNGYVPEQSAELYPTTGDTADWAYGELGIPAYTFELGETFFQPCDQLQQIMEENLGALLYAAKVPRTPYLTPSGPDALGLSVLPREIALGSPVQLTATIDDTRYSHLRGPEPTQNISAAAYYIDVPPWITTTSPITQVMSAADGSFDEAIETVQAAVNTEGLSSGRHTIYVRGQDASGHWGAISAIFLDVQESEVFLPLIVRGN